MSERLEVFKVEQKGRDPELAKFSEYFPNGEIKSVLPGEIPADILKFFEERSKNWRFNDYQPEDFENLFEITHGPGDKTYVAEQTKDIGGEIEHLFYLADELNQKMAGLCEIKKVESDEDFFNDKPYASEGETFGSNRLQGLSRRRHFIGNALCHMRYGLPLYSDTVLTPGGKAVWESLVEKGEARKFMEGEFERYVMAE